MPETRQILLPAMSDAWVVKAEAEVEGQDQIQFSFQLSCNSQMDFVYYKYDRLGRIIESGEYETSGDSAFTQTNADTASFPSNGSVIYREYGYDDPATGVSGQNNLKGRLSWAEASQLGDGNADVTTYYSYDNEGRIEWINQSGLGTLSREISVGYDRQDNIVQLDYNDATLITPLRLNYEYDETGRLTKVKSNFGGQDYEEARYQFFPAGNLKQKKLGELAQAIDYRYNTRDWLVAINKGNRDSFDSFQGRPENLFGMELGYQNESDFSGQLNAGKRYNGNVAWLQWALKDVTVHVPVWGIDVEQIGYVPDYDAAGRLKEAKFGKGTSGQFQQGDPYKLDHISYDDTGNLTSAKRHDDDGDEMDDYTYHYYNNSNRLERVEDEAEYEESQPDDNYLYDANGNMVRDKAAGIGFILYDIYNYPVRYYAENGSQYNCTYDHNGRRVKRHDGDKTWYYSYTPDGRMLTTATFDSGELLFMLQGIEKEGHIKVVSGQITDRYYYLKDHVGSIRMISDENGNRAAWKDFYPFGQEMPGRSGNLDGVDDRFGFTGQEKDAMTGYYHFGARYYEPRIGRFLSVDPEADEFPGVSPYAYALNSPLELIDPDGRYARGLFDGADVLKFHADPIEITAEAADEAELHELAEWVRNDPGLFRELWSIKDRLPGDVQGMLMAQYVRLSSGEVLREGLAHGGLVLGIGSAGITFGGITVGSSAVVGIGSTLGLGAGILQAGEQATAGNPLAGGFTLATSIGATKAYNAIRTARSIQRPLNETPAGRAVLQGTVFGNEFLLHQPPRILTNE